MENIIHLNKKYRYYATIVVSLFTIVMHFVSRILMLNNSCIVVLYKIVSVFMSFSIVFFFLATIVYIGNNKYKIAYIINLLKDIWSKNIYIMLLVIFIIFVFNLEPVIFFV